MFEHKQLKEIDDVAKQPRAVWGEGDRPFVSGGQSPEMTQTQQSSSVGEETVVSFGKLEDGKEKTGETMKGLELTEAANVPSGGKTVVINKPPVTEGKEMNIHTVDETFRGKQRFQNDESVSFLGEKEKKVGETEVPKDPDRGKDMPTLAESRITPRESLPLVKEVWNDETERNSPNQSHSESTEPNILLPKHGTEPERGNENESSVEGGIVSKHETIKNPSTSSAKVNTVLDNDELETVTMESSAANPRNEATVKNASGIENEASTKNESSIENEASVKNKSSTENKTSAEIKSVSTAAMSFKQQGNKGVAADKVNQLLQERMKEELLSSKEV